MIEARHERLLLTENLLKFALHQPQKLACVVDRRATKAAPPHKIYDLRLSESTARVSVWRASEKSITASSDAL